ncbi:MAG: NAD(P)/FAD-dependent oxidoreductase [Patulibacter minatonensis]
MDAPAPLDCIVIGGGAAGLSAALTLGRARRRVALLDAGGQSNLAADHIGGLLGYDGRPAPELYARGRQEIAAYPSVAIRDGLATGVTGDATAGFTVELAGGDALQGRRIILALGADYRFPELPGLAERFGQSVFHCPFCHGWEHADGELGVLDSSPVGVMRALMLRAWSDRVTLFTNGAEEAVLGAALREQAAAAGITIEPRPILRGEGDGTALSRLVVAGDGGEEARACTGLLVAITLEQRGGLADSLGVARQGEGYWAGQTLAVDVMGQTNVPGVSACGDASTANPSVSGAIASGQVAAAGVVHALTIPAAAAAATHA